MPRKRRYKDAVTILDSHKCPLCGKTGHLPQDCYLASGKYIHISNFERGEHSDTNEHFIQGDALTRHEKDEVEFIDFFHCSYTNCTRNAKKCVKIQRVVVVSVKVAVILFIVCTATAVSATSTICSITFNNFQHIINSIHSNYEN